jgi:hypothetical protein
MVAHAIDKREEKERVRGREDNSIAGLYYCNREKNVTSAHEDDKRRGWGYWDSGSAKGQHER